jgi:molybdate transport system substrate-binding protein
MTKESLQPNVLISGGFAGAYEQLLPEFQRMSGIKVTTGSGASQGSGPQTIAAQLGRGVAADVVILSREGLKELITAQMIAAGTDVDLARVRLGVAVRAGTTKPDVSTIEGFKPVTGLSYPDFRTISEFRKRHLGALSWRGCVINRPNGSA